MAVDRFGSTKGGNRNRRRQKEGRGQGLGAAYTPQLKVQDVASTGRSTRMPHDGRMVHLLSDLETRLLLELQWAPECSAIREQYPLPLERTLAIAEAIGARHPTIPGDGAPVVMTTDMVCLYTDTGGSIVCARAVKTADEIDVRFSDRSRRAARLSATLEKLEIEKRFWHEEGADWRLVCEHDLDRIRAANIALLLKWEGPDPSRGPVFWLEALDLAARTILAGQDYRLSELGQRLEREARLSPAEFMDCVRHLCATRVLAFDMTQHFGPELRACDLSLAA